MAIKKLKINMAQK